MEQNVDTVALLWMVLFPMAVLFILMIYFKVFRPFSERRRYIKMEMMQSDEGAEYNYWKRELKKLYIELIPIFGWFIKKSKR